MVIIPNPNQLAKHLSIQYLTFSPLPLSIYALEPMDDRGPTIVTQPLPVACTFCRLTSRPFKTGCANVWLSWSISTSISVLYYCMLKKDEKGLDDFKCWPWPYSCYKKWQERKTILVGGVSIKGSSWQTATNIEMPPRNAKLGGKRPFACHNLSEQTWHIRTLKIIENLSPTVQVQGTNSPVGFSCSSSMALRISFAPSSPGTMPARASTAFQVNKHRSVCLTVLSYVREICLHDPSLKINIFLKKSLPHDSASACPVCFFDHQQQMRHSQHKKQDIITSWIIPSLESREPFVCSQGLRLKKKLPKTTIDKCKMKRSSKLVCSLVLDVSQPRAVAPGCHLLSKLLVVMSGWADRALPRHIWMAPKAGSLGSGWTRPRNLVKPPPGWLNREFRRMLMGDGRWNWFFGKKTGVNIIHVHARANCTAWSPYSRWLSVLLIGPAEHHRKCRA